LKKYTQNGRENYERLLAVSKGRLVIIRINRLHISVFLVILLCLFLFSVMSCKEEKASGKAVAAKQVKRELKFSDDGSLVLAEDEVQSFLGAISAIRDLMKEKGGELEGANRNIFAALMARERIPEDVEGINNSLRPYGFDIGGLISTYGKIMGTYNYMMKLQTNKSSKNEVRRMKDLLEKPYIDEEQKEQMKELIKEMEEEGKTEEAIAYRKNIIIVKKYGAELKTLSNSF